MIKAVSFFNVRDGVNPEEVEKQYLEIHVPMASKIPGLRKYTIGKGRGKDRPYYRMAELYFDNRDALNAGFASSAGQSTLADPDFHALTKDLVTWYFDEEDVKA